MSEPEDDREQTEEIRRNLAVLQADYTRVNGSPFRHFFCPILHKDEPTELCMGHIVSQKLPNCCRARVVQRKDVDGFYGEVAEPEFATLIQARSATLKDVVFDPELRKKMRPKITVDGQEIEHYPFRGHTVPPQHAGFVLEHKEGGELKVVLRKSRDEVLADLTKDWKVVVERDCRIASVASLIKAAYLTLFRVLGYRYALSAGGIYVGYNILGDFFRAISGKPAAEAKAEADVYFRQFVNMVRPIHEFGGTAPLGTVEDNVAMACAGSSGKHFGLILFVRTGTLMHGVLMPAFEHADAVATYLDFLANENETLLVTYCRFDAEERCWSANEGRIPVTWPKRHESFRFD
jgi:hypothetical protein